MIPNTESSVSKTIQKDEVSLAYEFAKFPGVLCHGTCTRVSMQLTPCSFCTQPSTSENLSEKGVHEVRRAASC